MKRTHLRVAAVAWLLWAAGSWATHASVADVSAIPGPDEADREVQRAADPSAADSAHKSSSSPYLIQPGDTISVTVLGESQYSGSYTVLADGAILFRDDMVGTVPLAGQTVQQATKIVSARIGEYVKDPTVILAISRFNVLITGDVRRPGQYELDSGTRLMEAVAKAGGVKDERRDLERVYVKKMSGEELALNLRDFKENGDANQNPLVEPGDQISVGKAPSSNYAEFKVTGAVAEPGTYRLGEGEEIRISDAIDDAGRWTKDANPRSAQLIRQDGTKLTIDLTRLDEEPRSDQNVLLQQGDELFVPRNAAEVNVLGGVKNPGQYSVAPGTTVLEVISMAGGLADGAILTDCAVMRQGPQPARIGANLERLMKQGDMSQNPTLEDRDVVFIPVRPPARGGKNALEAISDNLIKFWWVFRYF